MCGAKNNAKAEEIISAWKTIPASGMPSRQEVKTSATAPAVAEQVPAAIPVPAYAADYANDMDHLDGTSWKAVFEHGSDVFRTVYTFSDGFILYSESNLSTGDSQTANLRFSILNNELTIVDEKGYSHAFHIYLDGDYLCLGGGKLTRVK